MADRQFHSIPQTYTSLLNNINDVKELIPGEILLASDWSILLILASDWSTLFSFQSSTFSPTFCSTTTTLIWENFKEKNRLLTMLFSPPGLTQVNTGFSLVNTDHVT